VLLPIGGLTKDDVRARAVALGLRTAGKPDSQDVCFISHSGGGRRVFLGDRIAMHPGRVVDDSGTELGAVEAVELITIGQRRGFGVGIDGNPRYALDVDVESRTVVVGPPEDLDIDGEILSTVVWADDAARSVASGSCPVLAQASAHGEPIAVESLCFDDLNGRVTMRWSAPQRRVAPGQSIVFYDGDVVLGGGIVIRR
jgi:tRNA-specific 2-thiouridylase